MTNIEEKRRTIETYDQSALEHAQKFNGMGARVEDIKRTFDYVQKPNPKTLEIGFGNGRDAREIANYTTNYLGIDLSSEMVKLAQESLPNLRFELADLETYDLPQNIDVIFAFASLLHSDKESLKTLLEKAESSLNPGGVFFISSKLDSYHKETIDKEGHGPKTYYFYTPEDIEEISPQGLKIVFKETQEVKGQNWFTVILQKA